jgi:quercetin dioxygenase-like cupin family protein
MKILHYETPNAIVVPMRGSQGVTIRKPIAIQDGAPTFTMRVFTFEPNGRIPYHKHDHEHEVFIVKGSGEILYEGGKKPVVQGSVVFVTPGEFHGFNAGPEGMQMLCLVPKRACEVGAPAATPGEWKDEGKDLA